MTYRLYIKINNGDIKYKDMNWNDLICKVKRVIKHPEIKKFWVRRNDKVVPPKYIFLTGTCNKPEMMVKY